MSAFKARSTRRRGTFGEIEGDVSGHIALGQPVLVSLFAGGKKLWGEFPFFEAAYLGGFKTMDGYNWNRFAGDASLYGSAELRWAFRKIRFTVPGELGLTLRADVGRVFLDGEDSNRWHSSGSVGIFYAPFRRLMLFEAGVGYSPENTFFYVRGRMRFLEEGFRFRTRIEHPRRSRSGSRYRRSAGYRRGYTRRRSCRGRTRRAGSTAR